MKFAVGYRTILCAMFALLTQIATAFGIDLGAIMHVLGIVPEQLADQADGGGPGLLNTAVTIVFLIGVVFFKWLANRREAGKPPSLRGGSQFVIACIGVALVLALAGCMQAPVKPQSIKQSIATAWITHGWANGAITDIRQSGLISAERFRQWAGELDQAEAHLTLADRLFVEGDLLDAQTRLDRATRILDALKPLIEEKLNEQRSRSSDADRPGTQDRPGREHAGRGRGGGRLAAA